MSVFQIGRGQNPPPPTFEDPAAVLAACHRRIEDRLATLARATAALGTPEAQAALADVVRFFDGAGVRHTEDEDSSIFPRLAGEGIDDLLATLEAEHRTTEAIYLAVRTIVARLAAEPALAAEPELAADLATHGAVLADAYREHMRREEAELFPRIGALDDAQKRAIGIEMRLRRGGEEQ